MKRFALIIPLLLLTACATTQPSTSHKIGFIGPLSGSKAKIGTSVMRGVKLAHNTTNTSTTLYIEDDKGSPKRAINAYKKLTNVNNVDAVIGVFSPQGNALAPLAEQDKTLYCDVGASDSTIFTNRSYVVSHWVSPENEAQRYAQHAAQLGYDTIATIEPQQAGVQAVMQALSTAVKKKGITLQRHKVPQSQKDFRTTITKIQNNKAVDAIFFILFPGQALPALKQLTKAGVDLPLTSVEIYAYYSDEAKSYLDADDWYVYASTPRESFVQTFKKHYPNAAIAMAGHGYDCYNLLTNALQHGNGNMSKAASYLHNLSNYPGAVGPLTYDNGRIDSPAIIMERRNGSFVPLE